MRSRSRSGARGDRASAGPLLDEPDREASGRLGNRGLVRMGSRDGVAAGRRQPEKLERGAHRVRGVLTATCARSGAGVLLDRAELGCVDAPGIEGADGFKDVLHREVVVAPASRLDGAAIEDEPGDVHPAQRHRRRRNRLVTTHDEHEAVEAVTRG